MLQRIYFDEGATGGGTSAPNPATQPSTQPQATGEPKPIKTFTQEEVNALITKELGKFEAKAAQKQKDIEESERLKSMSEQERQSEEVRKIKEELASYKREKFTAEYKSQLVEKGLPGELAAAIPVDDADKAKAVIDALTKYRETYEAKIKELEEKLKNADLRGQPPKSATAPVTAGATELKKMY